MSDKRLLAIYGASGAGRGIMPLLRAQTSGETEVECLFIDDGNGEYRVNGHRCLTFAQFAAEPADERRAAIAIADRNIRRNLVARCEEAGIGFLSITAREHVRMDDVEIGEGAIFSPFTTVTSNVRIGRHFQCNINSYVEHDCIIGDFVTFAPAVRCNGHVEIGDGAYLGAGAILRQGTPQKKLTIGRNAIIGMGAVVTRDVPPGVTVVGNPARQLKR